MGAVAVTGVRRRWITLAAIALGWLVILGTRFLLPAVLPQVRETFGLGNAGAGLAITVLWATYGLMQFPAGTLVDRAGERLLLAVSLILGGVSTLVVALSPTLFLFVVGCGALGLSSGLYGPARGMAISRTFPRNDGLAFGVALAVGSLGSALLPLAGGTLVGRLGWRTVVAAVVPAFVVTGVFTWLAVPARELSRSRRDRSPRAVVAGMRSRGVVAGTLGVTCMLFAWQGLSAFLPTYLIEVKGLDQGVAALLFALLFVSGAVSQIAGGNLADRFGERAVLTVVAVVAVVALVALPFTEGLVPLAALVVVIGSRLAIAPVTNAYIVASLPDAVTGTAWGALRSVFFLVGAAGSTVVGVFVDAGFFDEAFFAMAAITGCGGLLYAMMPTRRTAVKGEGI